MCGTNSLCGCWAIQPFPKERLVAYTHSHSFIGQVTVHICLFFTFARGEILGRPAQEIKLQHIVTNSYNITCLLNRPGQKIYLR